MPLDAMFLSGLKDELAEELVGAKIDKVQQPERDQILLTLRGKKLLLALGTGGARVHFTAQSYENPAEPPMFCMLLRKHLVGARITAVEQPQNERMLLFTLEHRDELGDSAKKTLAAELIGRSANLVLIGADGRIIDCLRREDFKAEAERSLLPGLIYRLPPPQKKRSVFTMDGESLCALCREADPTEPMDRWLLDRFSGLSPLLCRELAFRCGESYELLPLQLEALLESWRAGELTPTLLLENGEPRDYSFLPIRQYGETVTNERMESFSALLDSFYARRDRLERRRRRSQELTKTVRTLRDRQQRKLAVQSEELRRTEDREELRKRAELLTANLYRLKKGDARLVCEDYYAPGCPEITIELDPLKSPQQNAAALFKEVHRLKAAREHLTALISDGERLLDYLNSVLDELGRAETEKDVGDVRRELLEAGLLRQKKGGKPERQRPQAPLRFRTDDGLEVLVGRSNLQNDELTTKTARRTDLWLHSQKVHGSHVILRCEDAAPPERSIEQAASLAAYYSQGRQSGALTVDYTEVRHVKKPSGALPGKVVYTDYHSLRAVPDESLAERLRVKS